MYIVLEYYLLENFIINFLILSLTRVVTKSNIVIKNIILGSILCSIYSLVFFSPRLLFLTRAYMKIIISIFIIKFTFRSKSLKSFFYQLMGFYIISFIFAGAIVGISFNYNDISKLLFKESKLINLFKPKYIFIGLSIGIFISYKIFNYYHNKLAQESYIADVDIVYKGDKIPTKALVDTGNSLVEPFTNNPVFIVEFDEIKDILPLTLREFYMKRDICKDFYNIEEILKEIGGTMAIRLIPFKSVGSESGILLGFKPDYLVIRLPDRDEILEKSMIVGIYDGQLSSDLNYRGLLHYNTILQGDEA
ncbi:MAG: sigma-E processing peptidase SpoIIGA [Tissierellaceae bacterium]